MYYESLMVIKKEKTVIYTKMIKRKESKAIMTNKNHQLTKRGKKEP